MIEDEKDSTATDRRRGGLIPEIQGLRAIAVLSVVVYHFDSRLLSGGFVGVDIFFVISGFLISGLLINEVKQNSTIDFKAFYGRRIRRLLPAATLVTLTTLFFSRLIYAPLRWRDIGYDGLFTSIYGANFHFYFSQIDYSNLGSKPSPLIHFWSLAVEEQFYFIIPVVLICIYKFTQSKNLNRYLYLLFYMSFIESIRLTRSNPQFAFFSISTRFWELGAGTLIYIFSDKLRKLKFKPRAALALFGYCALLYSLLIFNDQLPFPGSRALVPVLGASAIIAASLSGVFPFSRILSSKLALWIGAISYSLYLWHWPAIRLLSELTRKPLPLWSVIILLPALMYISYLSFRFVETPFRSNSLLIKNSTNSLIAGAVLMVLTISGSAALVTYKSNNVSLDGLSISSLQAAIVPPASCMSTDNKLSEIGCVQGNESSHRDVVIFGDSHADQWVPVLNQLGKKNDFKLHIFTKAGCSPFEIRKYQVFAERKTNLEIDNKDCQDFRLKSYQLIRNLGGSPTVLLSSLPYINGPENIHNFWNIGVKKTIKNLGLPKSQIVILGDTPYPTVNVADCVSNLISNSQNQIRKGECSFAMNSSRLQVDSLDEERRLAGELGIAYQSTITWFCDRGVCPPLINKVLVYRDASHISVGGSLLMAEQLVTTIPALDRK